MLQKFDIDIQWTDNDIYRHSTLESMLMKFYKKSTSFQYKGRPEQMVIFLTYLCDYRFNNTKGLLTDAVCNGIWETIIMHHHNSLSVEHIKCLDDVKKTHKLCEKSMNNTFMKNKLEAIKSIS